MQSQLASVVDQLESARARVRFLAESIDPSRWALRRRPRAWSVAECIVHLNLAARAYIPLLRDALARAGPLPDASHRYRRDATGRFIGLVAGPLPQIGRWRIGRVRTSEAFVPVANSEQLARERVVSDFEALQDDLIALVRVAEGKALEEVRVVSPFDAHLKYNSYSCFVVLPRHQHRHLDQAEQVWR